MVNIQIIFHILEWTNEFVLFFANRNSNNTMTSRFANAYFNQSSHKINFIAVNWRKGSNTYNYLHARNRVNLVALHVAKFIDFMSKQARFNTKTLTIIGHSLGAHIAGIGEFYYSLVLLFDSIYHALRFFFSWKKDNKRKNRKNCWT